jgi:hypothetical protein
LPGGKRILVPADRQDITKELANPHCNLMGQRIAEGRTKGKHYFGRFPQPVAGFARRLNSPYCHPWFTAHISGAMPPIFAI